MEDNKWDFDVEINSWTLIFKDPIIEETYRSIRESKAVSYRPKILIIALCLGVILRRIMLIVDYVYGIEDGNVDRQIPLLIAGIVCLFLESLILIFKKFSIYRCTFLIISVFYYTADSSITYYIDRVKDEPVYSYKYFF